jgi:hypothetical protein
MGAEVKQFGKGTVGIFTAVTRKLSKPFVEIGDPAIQVYHGQWTTLIKGIPVKVQNFFVFHPLKGFVKEFGCDHSFLPSAFKP